MLMFWTFKLSFDEDFFVVLATVLATFFQKVSEFFSNLLVTLGQIKTGAFFS